MDFWIWVVLSGAVVLALAGVWWKRRARRVYAIDHVRVEMHPACVVEDRVVEVVWRAAISMKNISRRPRMLPMLAERATVRCGRRLYLATVYLEADASEINPGDVALAWVEFVSPAASPPRMLEIPLSAQRRSRSLLFGWGGSVRSDLRGSHRTEPPAKDIKWGLGASA